MKLRTLSLLTALAVSGCSSLERSSEPEFTYRPGRPQATRDIVSARTEPSLPNAARSRSDSIIQQAKFNQPASANGDLADAPALPLIQQPAEALLRARTIQETLNPPVVLETLETAAADPATRTLDLDLTGALAMASGQSPRITFAAARYREAYSRLQAAQALWLPSIRAGMSFNHHDGTLQASGGEVLDASRSSLQAGLGGRAIGAGSPTVPGLLAEFHASDAVFQPKIAAHGAAARNAATEAATNDTLLAAALAYLDLLRATQQLRIAEETRDNSQQLADLTATFARTGQGSQADADRAQTEFVRRRNGVFRSQEDTRVATARLAEILSLDLSLEIKPQETTIVPIELVSHKLPVADLVATGLANRPELTEAQYLVCEAVYRYRREKYAPLLPSVLLGVSQSGFGGGFGSRVDDFRGRFDFDASVFWELRNLGLGERARRNETSSQYDQARALQVSMMDRVAREVVESHAQIQSRHGQIEIAKLGVKTATDSFERNLARIREGQGLPIEAVQSLQALDESQREYLRALADYNEAQFRLQRALGWPIQ